MAAPFPFPQPGSPSPWWPQTWRRCSEYEPTSKKELEDGKWVFPSPASVLPTSSSVCCDRGVLGQVRGVDWVSEWKTVDPSPWALPGASCFFRKALGSGRRAQPALFWGLKVTPPQGTHRIPWLQNAMPWEDNRFKPFPHQGNSWLAQGWWNSLLPSNLNIEGWTLHCLPWNPRTGASF